MKKLLMDFKKFATKGDVLQLAVGVMIGGAFGKIVTSLVNDIFMPIIGIITGGFNFSGAFVPLDGQVYSSIELAKEAGSGVLAYGSFIQSIIDFILMALCIFLFVRLIEKSVPKKKEAPAKEARKCPFCMQEIADEATRCPHCTSMLDDK